MMEKINAVITGVGGYVPDYVLTNEEISRMVDTNDEWIMTRIGVKERRILNEEGLGTSYMPIPPVHRHLPLCSTHLCRHRDYKEISHETHQGRLQHHLSVSSLIKLKCHSEQSGESMLHYRFLTLFRMTNKYTSYIILLNPVRSCQQAEAYPECAG